MPDEPVAPYLRPGPEQEALLDLMDKGHAREQHGSDFGNPPSAHFKARIREHLQTAPEVYLGTSRGGHLAYLIADERTHQVAWIPPHTPQRATFFEPDGGVRRFVAKRAAGYGPDRWQPIPREGLQAARIPAVERTTARRIVSTARGAQPSARARVP